MTNRIKRIKIIYTLQDCIRDIGEIPYCACKCGLKVNINTTRYTRYKKNGYPKFISGHQFKNKIFTEEHRKHLSEAELGSKNHRTGKTNLKAAHRMKYENPNKDPIVAKRGADKRRGPKNGSWNGGTSFLPYCYKFDDNLKQDVRKRDEYICQFPGCLCTQLESLILYKDSLHTHHIHYDKANCYPDLITLCLKHNVKVNWNRSYYEDMFMNMLNNRNLLFWTIRRNKGINYV
jgi:hypothetical protein